MNLDYGEAVFNLTMMSTTTETTTLLAASNDSIMDDLYFITPHPDEDLAACTSTVLRSDLAVSERNDGQM
jgi:hypothetical protein